MSDKKNIDRLFQERFKDFEVVPNDKIWNNIHDALHDKKKKRVIPLWWKLSGIAAGFILAFLTFNSMTTTFGDEPAVVIAPKESESLDQNNSNNAIVNETKVAVENNSSVEKDENEDKSNLILLNPNSQNKSSAAKTISIKKNKIEASQNTGVANNTKDVRNQNLIKEKTVSQETIALNASSEKSNQKNELTSEEYNSNTDKVAVSNANNSNLKNLNKNSLSSQKDSTQIALSTEPNPLEEILKKKNEKENTVASAKLNRWQISTNVAPVYFNSASNGSPIEGQFAENRKSYENNLSVGIGVQYAVNKKLAVRTGVNKVTLGYGTNDVVFFGALNSTGVNNLSSSNSSSHIEVISANNSLGLKPFEDNLQNTESGVLNQRMGYYEVPLELSYALVNRKFGVQIIGGVSTLLLNENSVSVQSATTTMSLGKANNLKEVHFSGNAGLGFRYQFWNSFEAHFEPTLKYQFNTFSRDAGNFKPYFVGLYSGISFKF